MGGLGAAAIAGAYVEACRAELRALKPGNVHLFASGHRMTTADFETSALVSAGPLTRHGTPVGTRIRAAVEATFEAVGTNTNLGIVLLAAPLAAAAERAGGLAPNLRGVLADLDEADAADVYQAIRLASPAGLGQAEHDVAGPPRVGLRQAMASAAGRDRIARAYVTDFDDVFAVGLPALSAARRRGLDEAWSTTAVFLAFLSRFPDTHIVRKFGSGRGEAVRQRAERLCATHDLGEAAFDTLLAFDAELKSEGLNPGTSADFSVATLLADRLRQGAIAAESAADRLQP